MKNNRFLALIILAGMLLVSAACSFPLIQISSGAVTEPTSVPAVVFTQAAVTQAAVTQAVAEVEPTSTSAPVATTDPARVAVPIDWGGEWVIWRGSAAEKLNFDFLQQGALITGSAATTGGNSLLLKGTLSIDGKTLTGTWESTDGTSGSFMAYLGSALNQFSGNLGGTQPFCGARVGSAKPNPCQQ